MSLAFAGCSSDDEPMSNKGEEQVAYLRDFVLDKDGNVVYPESTTKGIYLLPTVSENAHKYTETIINDKWNGESLRYVLADGKGYINIENAPKEGVFVSLNFAVAGIPQFTLEIASEEYCSSENALARPSTSYYVCKKCGRYYSSKPSECGTCHGTSFDKNYGSVLL